MYYVATDIAGRMSGDLTSVQDVIDWMDAHNPGGVDCVVWEKPSHRLAAFRSDGTWTVLPDNHLVEMQEWIDRIS